MTIPDRIQRYCSWCFEFTRLRLVETPDWYDPLSRPAYQCTRCNNLTRECRTPRCSNMARGELASIGHDKEEDGFLKSLSNSWNSELCAEHDGTIASFERLSHRLSDIEEYQIIFKREKWNFLKAGTIAGGVVGGAVVFAPLAFLAAPGMAAALGASGLLGAAGTGTAIVTLSGAALTSASLAAIGGSVAGGTILMTATGGALGAVAGGAVSNGYFGDVDGFEIKKLREESGTSIIFINGFLSEKAEDFQDWLDGTSKHFSRSRCYIAEWEARAKYEIGRLMVSPGLEGLRQFAVKLAQRAARKAGGKLNPLAWAAMVADILGNPWHSTMVKAGMTGILLADLIARTPRRKYILMGHSLGARVIYYTLQALSTRTIKHIKDVYLFGGAVDRRDKKGWTAGAKAVEGTIHNCYSKSDYVLTYLYQGANALLSDPIGLGKIVLDSPQIRNWDFSETVTGHMRWKKNLSAVLDRIRNA